MDQSIVCIVWASRKRHIAIDKKLLCETKHKGGYSRGGHYNSYDLDSESFDKIRTEPDIDCGAHSSGIIPFIKLSEVKEKIVESSICKKCLKKYHKLTEEKYE